MKKQTGWDNSRFGKKTAHTNDSDARANFFSSFFKVDLIEKTGQKSRPHFSWRTLSLKKNSKYWRQKNLKKKIVCQPKMDISK